MIIILIDVIGDGPCVWSDQEWSMITGADRPTTDTPSWLKVCGLFIVFLESKAHCISGNVECVILYKAAFWTAKKGILDCQKACVGNQERSICVLHCHFGNPKCLFMAI